MSISLKQARLELFPFGMIISKRDGEFRVSFRIRHDGGKPEMTNARQEKLAYYTQDIDDAVSTGKVMARDYVSV